MDITGLLWSEIQEIRIAVEKHKEEQWINLTKEITNNMDFEEIKRFKKIFDMDRNQFRIEGRCNKILETIQKLDLDMQKEIEKT